MAMSSVIHKASHTVIPHSLRAIATPQILTGSVTKGLRGDEHGIVISNYQYFSTVVISDAQKRADRKVCELLKYKIKSVKRVNPDIQLPQPPAEFPFKIHDTPGEVDITLTRELDGENILIECSYYGENEDDVNLASEEYPNFRTGRVGFNVTISKEKGATTEFNCSGNIHRIRVDSISMDDREVKFSQSMDGDLRNHWGKFLAIRGIDKDLMRFVVMYLFRRNKRDRLLCLNKIRDFVKIKN